MSAFADRIAYRVKAASPRLFRAAESVGQICLGLRYGRRLAKARQIGRLTGTVRGQRGVMRPLCPEDANRLRKFLCSMASEHVEYFHPHGFDAAAVQRVLASKAISTYGLFVGDEMVAYGLMKVSPSGAAFLGELVAPSWAGWGLGRFLVAYLLWQASLAGMRARATISRDNKASLAAHAAVADYVVCAELPGDYLMIEFPNPPAQPPRLAH